jgi:antirestriction protein
MSSTRRIHVRCLASYNNGVYHDAWIDADQSEEEMLRDINALLRKSPCPNVTRRDFRCEYCGIDFMRDVSAVTDAVFQPKCTECDDASDVTASGAPYPSSEEWAIHDYEGFEGIKLSEHESLADIAELAKALEEHGAEYAAWREYHGAEYGTVERFEEAYRGTYDSKADYAEEFHRDCGTEIPGHLAQYIDWEKMGRDMDLSGDINAIELSGGRVAIFDGHA